MSSPANGPYPYPQGPAQQSGQAWQGDFARPGIASAEPAYRQPEYGAPAPQAPVQQWNAYPPASNPAVWVPQQRPVPASANVLAIIALVTSVLGMGIVPVICGHISLKQISRTGESGRGMAIAGLIVGYATIAFWALIAFLAVGLAAFSMR